MRSAQTQGLHVGVVMLTFSICETRFLSHSSFSPSVRTPLEHVRSQGCRGVWCGVSESLRSSTHVCSIWGGSRVNFRALLNPLWTGTLRVDSCSWCDHDQEWDSTICGQSLLRAQG